jgi:hypothetical protein
MAGVEDDEFQVIPTIWVELAVMRWHKMTEKADFKMGVMDSMGVDVARGGKDKTIISRRNGSYFQELIKKDGTLTPDGPTVVSQIMQCRRDAAVVHIDIIGWGSSPYDFLVDAEIQTIGLNSASSSFAVSREGSLPFVNLRAELWWKMREALDPENGDDICLPPDNDLFTELCSPKWMHKKSGIQVESKEEIKKRIGRSTDHADAVIYANVETMKRRDLELLSGGGKSVCGGSDWQPDYQD